MYGPSVGPVPVQSMDGPQQTTGALNGPGVTVSLEALESKHGKLCGFFIISKLYKVENLIG